MKHQLIIKLQQIKGIGNATIRKFLNAIKDFDLSNQRIIDAFVELHSTNKRILVPSLQQLEEAEEIAYKIIHHANANAIQLCAFADANYPALFYNILDAPMMLYVKGNMNLLNDENITLVGTRNPSEFGKKVTYHLANLILDNEFKIVSGLALGCDTIGHQLAVDNRIPTLAVLGHGLDFIYPSENTKLTYQILKTNGALVSELPHFALPSHHTFLQRDRLQSAFSHATIVAQTGITGGTLTTAKFAQEQKRMLACYDTDIVEGFEGNKQLIEQGAIKLISKQDIVNFLFRIERMYQQDFEEPQLNLF